MQFKYQNEIRYLKKIPTEFPLLDKVINLCSNSLMSTGITIIIAICLAISPTLIDLKIQGTYNFIDIFNLDFSNSIIHISDKVFKINPAYFMSIGVACLYFYIAYKKNKSIIIEAYPPTDNFVGIIGNKEVNSEAINKGKLLSRNQEVDYLINSFDTNTKKIFILYGKSGCGKSTLIKLLEYKYKLCSNLNWKDCTPHYCDIQICFDSCTSLQRTIFIFDQAERFLLDTAGERLETSLTLIINKINNSKNDLFIFIIRSEYLYKLIDRISQTNYETIGIIKAISKKQQHTQNIEYIICENDHKEVGLNKLCYKAFSSSSEKEIINFFSKCTLMEKQIFLNILDNEHLRHNDISQHPYISAEEKNELMRHFYDRQLCSTNNYWAAVRILYLLSIARKHNQTFTYFDFEGVLYDQSRDEIKDCLKKLISINLIAREDDTNGYEIMHDYIAETFINYSYVELEPAIRAPIEFYANNYLTEKDRKADDKDQPKNKKNQQIKFLDLLYIGSSLAILGTSIYKFNNYSDFSIIIFLPIYLCLFYGYKMYSKIMIHMFKKWVINVFSFINVLIFLMAIFYHNYWAAWMGGINGVMIGLPIIVYSLFSANTSRYFTYFGLRICAMSVAIIIIALSLSDKQLILIILMLLVLCFGYKTHLNNKFYYECYGRINNKY